jgi:hypothetical protein
VVLGSFIKSFAHGKRRLKHHVKHKGTSAVGVFTHQTNKERTSDLGVSKSFAHGKHGLKYRVKHEGNTDLGVINHQTSKQASKQASKQTPHINPPTNKQIRPFPGFLLGTGPVVCLAG